MAAARPLPPGLAGPVDLALARPADTVPEHTACPGGCRYELKFDGFRVAVVRTPSGARLCSRRGSDLTSAFPDLTAAADLYLGLGTVLVIKSANGRYRTGRRDWIKVKNRQTREVIVGAVIGSIRRPESVIAAALIDGELAVVGRTVALTTAHALQLAKHLTPADDDHPWPDELGTGVFGQRGRVAITKVRPELVVEVAADPALLGRRYRHALRYLRLRTDIDPTDVDAPA